MEPDSFCPFCEVIRSPSTRHCVICNRCVERYDHHCPWIDNCVGVRNHGTFLALMITLLIEFLLGLAISCVATVCLLFGGCSTYCNPNSAIFDILCEIKGMPIIYVAGLELAVLSLALLFCVVFTGYRIKFII